MVRMVDRNLFYDMELRICDPKMELWRETENHDFQVNEKSVLVPKIEL